MRANVKAKETETQKVADSSVSYEPVKAGAIVKSVDNNEIKDDSHEAA